MAIGSRRPNFLLESSIGLASRLVIQSDISYHAQLARIERLRAGGGDITKDEQLAIYLKQQLDNNGRWLDFLRDLEANGSPAADRSLAARSDSGLAASRAPDPVLNGWNRVVACQAAKGG